jgi:hypothetical protein
LDGFGTSTVLGSGDAVGAELGEVGTETGGEVAPGDVTLVVPAVEHAVSRRAIEQR